MRLAFFGNFYPTTQKAGNSSTGLVILLAQRAEVEHIELFASTGAVLPATVEPGKVRLVEGWTPGSAPSLVRALLRLLRVAPDVDGYIFNVHMTSFGRSLPVNGLGLLLPPLVRRLTGKPVVTYMHNFVSTQDVTKLGYRPGALVRWTARALERGLLRNTRVLVPLGSMATELSALHGVSVGVVFLPYVEAIHTLMMQGDRMARMPPPPGGRRILLFGHWGPQKDLSRMLATLTELLQVRPGLSASVAGEVNVNFPEYQELVARFGSVDSKGRFHMLGHVDEEEIATLFGSHDLLVLPYSASGGYSGAMNAAAPFGIGIVAYDLPQLRETAAQLGLNVRFIPHDRTASIREGLMAAIDDPADPRGPLVDLSVVLERAQRAVGQILAELNPSPTPFE